ncbi:MAG: phosphotransferase [Pseudomonadota bacterium]
MGAQDTEFAAALQAHCEAVLGNAHAITNLRHLTGGASMETWSFDYGDQPLILRRRAAKGSFDERQPLPLAKEAAFIQAAGTVGVTVPRIFATTDETHSLSETVMMERLTGEALPQKLFRDPAYAGGLSNFTRDCAINLARIHAAPTSDLFAPEDTKRPADMVADRIALYEQYGGDSPIQCLAFRWLQDNLPAPAEDTLCHGDFRMGNLLVGRDGISGVLDWELAFHGDPISDLGYLCAPCWRFGVYDRPVGGVGQIEELITQYEVASGRTVEPDRFRFWMIYASLNWSVMCMTMIDLWRQGLARELERPVIGTRVSESEIDLILMLEDAIANAPSDRLTPFDLPDDGAPSGDTKSRELAKALGEWLTEDVIKAMEGREQFKARIARNAAGILERSAALDGRFEARQAERLEALGYDNGGLCQAILKGDVTLATPGLLDHLRLLAAERCYVQQPKYAGLKTALKKWSPE